MRFTTLHPDVAAKYKLVTIRPAKYDFAEFGTINLCEISLKKADELFEKGFPFFKLQENPAPNIVKTPPPPEKQVQTQQTQPPQTSPVTLRSKKQYINKLLTLDWSDFDYRDKLVFFNSEKYFLRKKMIFIANVETHRNMVQIHTKVKTMTGAEFTNTDRAILMIKLADAEKTTTVNWKEIDTWTEPVVEKPDKDLSVEEAVQRALEKEKKIKANKIYIYRAEKTLPGMSEDTEKQRLQKQTKQDEITRRRQELIDFGQPYD